MSTQSDLTFQEQKNVRTAIRYLRFRIGTWEPLAKALHLAADTLEKSTNGRRSISANVAVRVARFAGINFDDLIAGKFAPEGTCPHCGHPPDFNDDDATVAG